MRPLRELLCWGVRRTTRHCNLQGRSSLHGSAELVRKTGRDHEIAPCSILLRFEILTSRSDTVDDGARGIGHKADAIISFTGRAKLFLIQVIKSMGFILII